ncbi:cyclin-P3-1 isoform X3 [Cynara cardunculus var. scolymus]|uniref:cyclin-P3-1 isoform X3 n=1 Tax=Cynara cardunculus var. scolymus TaxID=59895 RepID=UPI000D628DED|nr:cyclin-P3-1 isoform X3 [Cynara cardunculus var. scolymus]
MDDASRTSTPCLDMEGSTLENDILGSKLYISLGLKGQMNQNPGNPKALSFISSLLQKSVEKNETMLQTTQTKDELITVFHGSRAPTLTIQQYVDRIFKYSRCSPSCFIVAYVYIDRFIRSGNIVVTSLNVHRLLITSVMLAAKFIDDEFRYCSSSEWLDLNKFCSI